MRRRRLTGPLGTLALCLLAGPITAAEQPGCDANDGGLQLPAGFCALTVADGLGNARHLTVAPNGDLYVAIDTRGDEMGGIAALRDTSGDGRMDEQIRFGEAGGTGIALHQGYLYFGEDTRIIRYRLQDQHLGPEDDPEVIAHDFPSQDSHAAKPFAFDDDGSLYVNSGAPSNNCQRNDRAPGSPGIDPCPELEHGGGIWRFDADRTGQAQGDGERYATGIRNSVALAWNPRDDNLFVVQHGRDQLSDWEAHFDHEDNAELPSEEFLRVTPGSDFGWPYCYHDPRRSERVLAPEYGGDGQETADCNDQFPAPELAFPAHLAPNDLLFYTGEQFPERYRGGAFVAFHGSWNRAPGEQRGYKVAFVPVDEDGRVNAQGEWQVFADGFAGTDKVESPDDAAHRPMGIAQGPDGSLYVSDSQRGRIWRIMYRGEEGREPPSLRRQAERLIERLLR